LRQLWIWTFGSLAYKFTTVSEWTRKWTWTRNLSQCGMSQITRPLRHTHAHTCTATQIYEWVCRRPRATQVTCLKRLPPLQLSRPFRSPAGVIDSDNFRRRRADGQRPHPVAAHRGRPDAAPRTSSRPTHLCAGMTAGVPDWWGAVGSALHTVSRRCSSVRHRRLWHGPALGAAVRA